MFNDYAYPQFISIEDEIEEANKMRVEETLTLSKRVDSLTLGTRLHRVCMPRMKLRKRRKDFSAKRLNSIWNRIVF